MVCLAFGCALASCGTETVGGVPEGSRAGTASASVDRTAEPDASKAATTAQPDVSEMDTTKKTETPAPTTAVPAGATLESYIASMQDEMGQMEDGSSLKIEARGNALVYSYQFPDMGLDGDLLKNAMEQALEGAAPTFEELVPMVRQEVAELESIVVEYLDVNGELLASREFK